MTTKLNEWMLMYIVVITYITSTFYFNIWFIIFFDAKSAWNYVCVHQSMLIMFNKCNCDKFFYCT